MARTVSSSVLPARTFGQTGSSGLRALRHRPRSAARSRACCRRPPAGRRTAARMSAAGLNQCSGVTRRRSGSDSSRPSAMHSSASCASCMSGVGEVAVVGGDQRDAGCVGQRDQAGLDRALAGQAVALQLHRDAIRERLGQAREQAFGLRLLALGQQPGERARWRRRSAGSAPRRAPRPRRAGVAASGRDRCPGSRARTGAAGWRARSRPAPAARPGRAAGADCRRARSAIWQPMIGWMPLAAQAWLNSSAPNRLAVSVIATAGIAPSRARAAILSALMAPSLSE